MKTSKPNSRFVDISGQTFGRLTAIKHVGYTPNSKQLWKFRCDCGKVCIKVSNSVRGDAAKGRSPGCGCRQFEGKGRLTHGKHGTPEYIAWKAMRQRCNDPKTIGYSNYGGRGIRVCKRWDDFALFLSDMGEKPSPKHTIERRDNNGDYCPKNCYWATRAVQSRNTRQNRMLTHNGKTMCITDWATELGIKKSSMFKRLETMPVEKALTQPIQKHESRPITFQGKTHTAKEWSRITRIPYGTILWRIKHRKTPNEILQK